MKTKKMKALSAKELKCVYGGFADPRTLQNPNPDDPTKPLLDIIFRPTDIACW